MNRTLLTKYYQSVQLMKRTISIHIEYIQQKATDKVSK